MRKLSRLQMCIYYHSVKFINYILVYCNSFYLLNLSISEWGFHWGCFFLRSLPLWLWFCPSLPTHFLMFCHTHHKIHATRFIKISYSSFRTDLLDYHVPCSASPEFHFCLLFSSTPSPLKAISWVSLFMTWFPTFWFHFVLEIS